MQCVLARHEHGPEHLLEQVPQRPHGLGQRFVHRHTVEWSAVLSRLFQEPPQPNGYDRNREAQWMTIFDFGPQIGRRVQHAIAQGVSLDAGRANVT